MASHVDIGPFKVEDTELQKLHRKGLAQEYDVNGTSDEITVTIDPSNPGSAAPPPAAAATETAAIRGAPVARPDPSP